MEEDRILLPSLNLYDFKTELPYLICEFTHSVVIQQTIAGPSTQDLNMCVLLLIFQTPSQFLTEMQYYKSATAQLPPLFRVSRDHLAPRPSFRARGNCLPLPHVSSLPVLLLLVACLTSQVFLSPFRKLNLSSFPPVTSGKNYFFLLLCVPCVSPIVERFQTLWVSTENSSPTASSLRPAPTPTPAPNQQVLSRACSPLSGSAPS